MRVPTGSTDRYLYFVALDSAGDRLTGLSSFTVVRSRNGAADATYTTPTISEIDSSTMPGVYALLVDEDTTITSGKDEQEYCVHITHAGMEPVTRTFELYRPKATEGETVGVSSGAVSSVTTTATATTLTNDPTGVTTLLSRLSATRAGYLDNLSAGAVATAEKLLSYFQSALRKDVTVDSDIGGNYDDATDSLEAIRDRGDAAWTTATGFSTHSASDVWAVGTRRLTDATNISGPIADQVWEEALADHEGTVGSTAEALADAGGSGASAADIADAVWDEATAGHTTGGTFGAQAKTVLDTKASQTSVDDIPTNAELATALAAADDAVLAAIAALNNLSAAQVNAQVLDVLAVDTFAEPSAVPAATATLKDKIGWLAVLARNAITQTATTQTLKNDAGSGDIATAAVSDTGTTFTRAEWT